MCIRPVKMINDLVLSDTCDWKYLPDDTTASEVVPKAKVKSVVHNLVLIK